MAADFDDAFASDDDVKPVKAAEPTVAPEEATQMAADFDDAFASDDDVKPIKKEEPAVINKEVPLTPKSAASKKKNKKKAKKG